MYTILCLHGSRQGVVCCISRIDCPASNMGLIELKGTVAYSGPEERAVTIAGTKTVLHSPHWRGSSAGAA